MVSSIACSRADGTRQSIVRSIQSQLCRPNQSARCARARMQICKNFTFFLIHFIICTHFRKWSLALAPNPPNLSVFIPFLSWEEPPCLWALLPFLSSTTPNLFRNFQELWLWFVCGGKRALEWEEKNGLDYMGECLWQTAANNESRSQTTVSVVAEQFSSCVRTRQYVTRTDSPSLDWESEIDEHTLKSPSEARPNMLSRPSQITQGTQTLESWGFPGLPWHFLSRLSH